MRTRNMSARLRRTIVPALGMAGITALLGAASVQSTKAVPSGRPTTVLFMCPHGAAKSVLASAYFQRAAKARGLNVRVDAAGTDPDQAVSAKVAARLTEQGYDIPIKTPRRVIPQEVEHADIVVSLGCDLTGLPKPLGTLYRWDDVPPPSEDFARADEEIRQKVIALVDELVRAQEKSKKE
jgi:arsenate reductase